MFVLRNVRLLSGTQTSTFALLTFENNFDSVHRDTLWKFMKAYGIPDKLIEMVKIMYKDNRCSVAGDTGIHEWFDIKSGVKQGCNMSGFFVPVHY